jgi:hypothetical protein
MLIICVGAATPAASHSRFPLFISAGSHSLTVPWHTGPITKRFNPALVAGTERTLKHGRHLRLYQTANLGFFQHYWWMTGLFLDTELGISRQLPLHLHADLRLGAGYLHYFWRRRTLELEHGEYVEARDWGRPSLVIPLSIVLGYRRSSDRPFSVAPFVSAQWAVQALFTDEIPVMTHFILQVGVRINLLGLASNEEK